MVVGFIFHFSSCVSCYLLALPRFFVTLAVLDGFSKYFLLVLASDEAPLSNF
jgi:hypothetical protein